ncbi:arylsulfatase J-like [Aricia agestis]|uniref:arylsulfatase J-like n=1 Tax=Aricia agestis TaxID=91739 RepID=UPI001C201BF0|nr:arylsulfatase J-like [Aricia agestis]XP_041970819.1 arylsulfatase J-like [Aricia agestis]
MGRFRASILILYCCVTGAITTRPNVVFIIADDMGWDDVSFHGSDQIPTPNIDLLAYSGITLERYYSHCLCTPSRSALLTGKYSHVTGMQGYPLTNSEDRGLPLTEKILPEYFKELGYDTHLVGKWHVGSSRPEYLPTNRGFDSHFGHRGGYVDYYEYVLTEQLGDEVLSGMDLFKNMTQAWDVEGYITDVYTQEAKTVIKNHDVSRPLFLMVGHNAPHAGNEVSDLQAPPDYVRSMRHIESPQRRIYAAMVKKLDESVGDIVAALQEKGILNDTIIVFVSDNGGMTSGSVQNFASNRPLRGLKFTPFEGGNRVIGLIWNKNLTEGNHLWKGYIHVSDWLPTLLKAVGVNSPENIDGVNLWENIVANKESKRNTLFEIDDMAGFASIIHGDYKLITGEVITENSNHQGERVTGLITKPPNYIKELENSKMYTVLKDVGINFDFNNTELRNNIKISCHGKNRKELCYPDKDKLCLFNIRDDPCEYEDISAENPDIVEKLYDILQNELMRLKPRPPMARDIRSHPRLHNYTWNTWMDAVQ